MRKVHYLWRSGDGNWTACRRPAVGLERTFQVNEATCLNCRKMLVKVHDSIDWSKVTHRRMVLHKGSATLVLHDS